MLLMTTFQARVQYILEPEILGNRNINFNYILISSHWFLIAELDRYLCYGCLKFPARV